MAGPIQGERKISRREFLKLVGAGSVGLLIPEAVRGDLVGQEEIELSEESELLTYSMRTIGMEYARANGFAEDWHKGVECRVDIRGVGGQSVDGAVVQVYRPKEEGEVVKEKYMVAGEIVIIKDIDLDDSDLRVTYQLPRFPINWLKKGDPGMMFTPKFKEGQHTVFHITQLAVPTINAPVKREKPVNA